MKNNLTAEEWLALSEFVKNLNPSSFKLSPMFEDVNEHEITIVESAKKKFLKAAEEIKKHELKS